MSLSLKPVSPEMAHSKVHQEKGQTRALEELHRLINKLITPHCQS